MSNLAALLKTTEKSADGEKLMDLYWNRNELKKEFAELRNEKFRLQEKIKQQDGDIARIEQKLSHIEELLIDPEWGRSALVHYQLRGTAQRCERKLARFAEQIKLKRERKMRDQELAAWRAGIEAERAAVERKLAAHEAEIIRLEDQRRSENRRLAETSSLLRPFRSRSINAHIEALSEGIVAEESGKAALEIELAALAERAPPDNMGLDVAAKRSVNLMILAFAQQLYLQFDDDDLVALIKDANEKSAGAIKYGDKQDCESILTRLTNGLRRMEEGGDSATLLRRRAGLIGEAAAFADADDVVPLPGSVATLVRIDQSGHVSGGDANILGDNYWGVAEVLSL